jgi:uncharacterized protein YjbJ (UPF0337 family)
MSNESTIKGKIDEVTGKLKQSVGEMTGNDSAANAGAAQQVKGHAEQAWGSVKDGVHDAKERNKPEHDAKAHDFREKVVAAAQNVKEHIEHAVSPDHKNI